VRQITVTTPEGRAADIARIAFGLGINEVSVDHIRVLRPDGSETTKERIDIDTGTHLAKALVDVLTNSSFFDLEHYTIAVRQPRSIVSRERISVLTRPLVEPATDLFQELNQFCQVTFGFIGRVFIGALLLGLGILDDRLLFMIAGLLFIPLLPLILGIGFSVCARQWYLFRQAALALTVALMLLVIAGITVALLNDRPIRYSESSSLLTGFLISFAVGVAAALATADDVGRREMIGLAATAQVAIIPVWLGLSLVNGFPILASTPPSRRVWGLIINMIAIVISSSITYAVLRVKGRTLAVFDEVFASRAK
jgi:hypothetical protein